MNLKSALRTMVSILVLAIVFTTPDALAQQRYSTNNAKISIDGTSTLHDWTMTSNELSCDATFETNSNGNLLKLTSLAVSLPAESLKSEKTAMDKNAYKTLKTDVYKQIAFQLVSSRTDAKGIHSTGKLTIAGTTKQVDLDVAYTVLPNGSLQCKGSKKLVMTDYNVEPPSFMFGSVTTGAEITISFDVTLAPANHQPVTLN